MGTKAGAGHKKVQSVSKIKEQNGVKNSPRSDVMEAARSISMVCLLLCF